MSDGDLSSTVVKAVAALPLLIAAAIALAVVMSYLADLTPLGYEFGVREAIAGLLVLEALPVQIIGDADA